jgi:anti-sigma regulatory factor (Ser/Thr protein kinase)
MVVRVHADERPTLGRFDHAALIVDSDETISQLLVPVLREHIHAGEAVLVVVSPDTELALRHHLGRHADDLEWGAPDAFYQRLGFAFEGFRRYLHDQHAQGRTVHVVAEPDITTDLDSPVDRVAAYLSYEAMCNDAYAEYGCPVTCIWDSRRHPTLVIEDVRSIHDHELTPAGRRENRAFVPASDYLAGRADVDLPPAPPVVDAAFAVADMDELPQCRSTIAAWARSHQFIGTAVDQVTAATNEIVANGLQHGRAPVRVRAWHHQVRQRDRTLVVQVDDLGGRRIPPDAGYRRPTRAGDRMGLWVARQFADVVLVNTRAYQTSVRLYFPHGVTHRNLDERAA